MPGAAAGRQRDFALDRRVGAHDAMDVVAGVTQLRGMGLQQAVQHFDHELVGVVEDLLHRVRSFDR